MYELNNIKIRVISFSSQAVGCVVELAFKVASGELKVGLFTGNLPFVVSVPSGWEIYRG